MSGTPLPVERTIAVRALANQWISKNFPHRRRYLSHAAPTLGKGDNNCRVELLVRRGKNAVAVGTLSINGVTAQLVEGTVEGIVRVLDAIAATNETRVLLEPQRGRFHDFRFGDGLAGTMTLADKSVDLLLTDPPYGISTPYVCESQVPRRLRKDGRDFIMPKGHFGPWDDQFPPPDEWATSVLPKVRGWVVIFCAQTQISDYTAILKDQRFVAVGAMVWQKTNPVPFNHTFKPINAWEAIAVGKRPGTKFNGHVVHNVFKCKSPSPQHRIHPTQKPLQLISDFVNLFSNSGDMVLDPFAGSATTVIAAARLGRHVLAFENDPDAFRAASSRVAGSGLGI